MTDYAVDDHESIRRRMEELKAERDLALTGSSAPQEPEQAWSYMGEAAVGWPYTAYDISKA